MASWHFHEPNQIPQNNMPLYHQQIPMPAPQNTTHYPIIYGNFYPFTNQNPIAIQQQTSRTTLCKYYGSAAGCKYGNRCRFIHVKNPVHIPLCKFFQTQNGCAYGNLCYYRHIVSDQPKLNNNPPSTDTKKVNKKHALPFPTEYSKSAPKYMQYDLLISGYLREYKTYLIPNEIKQITRKYFRNFNLFILQINKKRIFCKNIENPQKRIQFELNQDFKFVPIHKNACFAENIKLSNNFKDVIKKETNAKLNEYNAIFQTHRNAVIIFDSLKWNKYETKTINIVNGYYYDLPSLSWNDNLNPNNINMTLYSKQYGLISGIAGSFETMQIYNLPLVNGSLDHKACWKELRGMNKTRGEYCSVIINDNTSNGNDKLVLGCGYSSKTLADIGTFDLGHLTSFEIYDFEKDEWMNIANCNETRRNAAICYDEITHNMYIGGGRRECITNIGLERYDFVKNCWYLLPMLPFPHDMQCHPVLFCDINVLYMFGGCHTTKMQYIDLRTDKAGIFDFFKANTGPNDLIQFS